MQHLVFQDQEPPQDHHIEIGKLYTDARQEHQLKLKDIAEVLCIRQIYLEAIEQGNFHALPGKVYTIGFMKKYAEFLKLDFQEIHRRLNLHDDDSVILSREDITQPYSSAGYKKYLWISLILILASGGSYTYLRLMHAPRIPEFKIEAPVVAPPAPVVVEEPIIADSAPPPPPAIETPITKPAVLVLHAVQPTWVYVRDASGQSIFKSILKTGERYTLPSQPGLIIKIGNAAGLEIWKDETRLPSLGKAGQVVELSIESLTN